MATKPVQKRSRQTYDRIMDAAELVLNEKNWPEVTIQEIVKKARSSIGSFYARFDSKEELLEHLSSRLSDHTAARFEKLNAQFSELTTEVFIGRTISELIRFHHQHRGIIRALTLVPRLDGSVSLRSDGMRNAEIFGSLARRLAQLSSDPHKVRLGLFVVSMAIREAIVFPTIAESLLEITQDELARELTALLTSYLGD